MKSRLIIFSALFILILSGSCKQKDSNADLNIVFLHHSTGLVIWNGESTSKIAKFVRRKSSRLANLIGAKAQLPLLFEKYNKEHHKNYRIEEMVFPYAPYDWVNYPYDYYNIWVKNASEKPYMEQPTLEMLSNEYQVIIFKHCFPASNIQEDMDSADINSDIKTLSNYKLQYLALRDKLYEFPDTKFILFTGAVQVKSSISEDEARRAKEFFEWVTNEWDLPGDNIHIWDFYKLQTEGGLYFREDYAVSATDSHPNEEFARQAVKLLFNRIIEVIEKDEVGQD